MVQRNIEKSRSGRCGRRGAITPLVVILMIGMMALGVFALDYGHLLVVRTDLQRAADNAALAAVRELVPETDGFQDVAEAKRVLRSYASANLSDPTFTVSEQDIQIGRYDPNTIYSGLTLLNDGVLDTVSVTLRRDDLANTSVSLLFSRIFGISEAGVSASATAVLQKARFLTPGADILPIAIPQQTWNSQRTNTQWSIYGDGRLIDAYGDQVPGNWGSIDVGANSNANSDIKDQILDGLRQSDLDSLANQGSISDSNFIDSDHSMWLSGDTGLSSGMKDAIIQSHGTKKLIPIFDTLNDNTKGGNLNYHVVGWGVVEIVTSNWGGNNDTSVIIKKSYTYDGELRPHADLDNTSEIIENAFTSPVLVE